MSSRKNIFLTSFALLGAGGLAVFSFAPSAPAPGAPASAPAALSVPELPPEAGASAAVEIPAVAPDNVLTRATIDRLVRDAMSEDAGTRADAIDALAAAPETDALPVLEKVLVSGADIDRQLALSSLHVLAVRYGDSSGAIRELLRQTIYDGGDEAVAGGAQAALDDIERAGERHAAAGMVDNAR